MNKPGTVVYLTTQQAETLRDLVRDQIIDARRAIKAADNYMQRVLIGVITHHRNTNRNLRNMHFYAPQRKEVVHHA